MKDRKELVTLATQLREMAESGDLGPMLHDAESGNFTFALAVKAMAEVVATCPDWQTYPLEDRWISLNRMRVFADVYLREGPRACAVVANRFMNV